MYYDGQGTSKNNDEAFKFFQKAVECGNQKAFAFLGIMYENGEGVAKDYSRSVDCYKKAVEFETVGGGICENAISRMYYEGGFGLSQDFKECAHRLLKAANAGNIDAMGNIGCFYTYPSELFGEENPPEVKIMMYYFYLVIYT